MMIDIEKWMDVFVKRLKNEFGEDLMFCGLQGSYRRSEQSDDSDIDVVVILKELSEPILKRYKIIMLSMPHAEIISGFLSGADELKNWPEFELFQFESDTRAYYGDLHLLAKKPELEDIKYGLRTEASALYHAAVHSYLHNVEGNLVEAVNICRKKALFILYMLAYLKYGQYPADKKELAETLKHDPDLKIFDLCENFGGSVLEAPDVLIKLIKWSGQVLDGKEV